MSEVITTVYWRVGGGADLKSRRAEVWTQNEDDTTGWTRDEYPVHLEEKRWVVS